MSSQASNNPFDEFDQDVRTDIDGLIHLGEISTEVEFCGHTFGLRTLRVDEEIAAAKIVESFRETLREPQAWAAAQLGLALTHVDNDPEFCPSIGPDKVAFARARFSYITSNWYWATIEYLFAEYAKLLERQLIAIRAVQDLSSGSRNSFSPSPDSLNDLGAFESQISTEIQ